jgi:hypothetical protein
MYWFMLKHVDPKKNRYTSASLRTTKLWRRAIAE